MLPFVGAGVFFSELHECPLPHLTLLVFSKADSPILQAHREGSKKTTAVDFNLKAQ